MIEWLTSPFIYAADEWFREEFGALANRLADRELVARHYLHLGERQRGAYFADGKQVPLKKVFYALRPAAALRWLRCHPADAVAPMNFPALLTQCATPDDVQEIVANLITQKSVTHELGVGELPPVIASFIDSEFAAARKLFGTGPRPATLSARSQAQKFFRDVLAHVPA